MADGGGCSQMNAPAVPEGDTHQTARPPQRDRIIEAVLAAGATFWPDADGVAHVTLPARDDTGPWRFRVGGSDFRKVVRRLYAVRNVSTTMRQPV